MSDTQKVDQRDRQFIDHVFQYHSPIGNQADRYGAIRARARDLAHDLIRMCPPNPDRTAALSKLREVVYAANAAIACGETGTEGVRPLD